MGNGVCFGKLGNNKVIKKLLVVTDSSTQLKGTFPFVSYSRTEGNRTLLRMETVMEDFPFLWLE